MSKKVMYKTVSGEGEAMLVEKRSKFIATVYPVDNEPKAIELLNSLRSKYSDATHNVYAYIIDENNIFRYSDDGEPSGTAGMPVLDTIRKEGIVDVLVVVTRYFGGTLLGTGGLVHAYGGAARQGLLAAGIVNRCLCDILCVNVDYTMAGKVQYHLSSKGFTVEDTVYDSRVTFFVCCKPGEAQELTQALTELTSGRADCRVTDKKYVDLV